MSSQIDQDLHHQIMMNNTLEPQLLSNATQQSVKCFRFQLQDVGLRDELQQIEMDCHVQAPIASLLIQQRGEYVGRIRTYYHHHLQSGPHLNPTSVNIDKVAERGGPSDREDSIIISAIYDVLIIENSCAQGCLDDASNLTKISLFSQMLCEEQAA